MRKGYKKRNNIGLSTWPKCHLTHLERNMVGKTFSQSSSKQLKRTESNGVNHIFIT